MKYLMLWDSPKHSSKSKTSVITGITYSDVHRYLSDLQHFHARMHEAGLSISFPLFDSACLVCLFLCLPAVSTAWYT